MTTMQSRTTTNAKEREGNYHDLLEVASFNFFKQILPSYIAFCKMCTVLFHSIE